MQKKNAKKGEIAQEIADVVQEDILDGNTAPENQKETVDAVKKFFDEVK